MERLYETLGRGRGVAETMVDEAKVLDPETIFRAGSTGMEVELVAGLAGLLASEVPGAAIRAQREPFDRLYGPQSADALATSVAEEIESAAAGGIEAPCPAAPRIYLDPIVADQTRSIAEDLKAMYSDHAADPDHDPAARVGRSMGEIVARLPGEDPLLASRCVDFAATTSVPTATSARSAPASRPRPPRRSATASPSTPAATGSSRCHVTSSPPWSRFCARWSARTTRSCSPPCRLPRHGRSSSATTTGR
jgi:hypothetical protein